MDFHSEFVASFEVNERILNSDFFLVSQYLITSNKHLYKYISKKIWFHNGKLKMYFKIEIIFLESQGKFYH